MSDNHRCQPKIGPFIAYSCRFPDPTPTGTSAILTQPGPDPTQTGVGGSGSNLTRPRPESAGPDPIKRSGLGGSRAVRRGRVGGSSVRPTPPESERSGLLPPQPLASRAGQDPTRLGPGWLGPNLSWVGSGRGGRGRACSRKLGRVLSGWVVGCLDVG